MHFPVQGPIPRGRSLSEPSAAARIRSYGARTQDVDPSTYRIVVQRLALFRAHRDKAGVYAAAARARPAVRASQICRSGICTAPPPPD